MAEPGGDPNDRELLERIVNLEAENSRLRARLDDVQEGLDIFMAATANEFAHVNDLLWPLADKLLPNLREMKSKMEAIVPPVWADPRADRRRNENSN